MCLAVPGKVVSVAGDAAVIDVLGVQRTVAINFTQDVVPGDYLMVHAGYAIEKVDVVEAERSLELFRELGLLMEETTGE